MKKQFNNVLFIVLIVITCFGSAFGQSADDNGNKISSRLITDLEFNNVTLLNALHKISHNYQIPIGIEYYPKLDSRKDKLIQLSIKKSTLGNVLDLITQSNSEYSWVEYNGVINVFPLKTRTKILEKFLSIKIDTFNTDLTVDRISIINYLIELPSIQNFLLRNNATAFNVGLPRTINKNLPTTIFQEVRQLDVRDVLNKLVSKSDYKFWLIQNIELDDKEYIIHITF